MSEPIFEEDKGGEDAGQEGKEIKSEESSGKETGTEEGSGSEESSGGSETDRSKEGVRSESEEADNSTEDAEVEESEEGEEESEGEQPLQLSLPEESLLHDDHITEITQRAEELGLSQDQAQEWLNDRSEIVSEMLENAQSIIEKQAREELAEASAAWKEELMNDPDVGGDKISETAELAKRFAEAYLPPELNEWLEETGYGNQPGLVKAFRQAAIDIGIAGDSIVTGGSHSPSPKSDSEIFYGKKSS